jgi:pSer/pThr/pTyr-binding forkhead associated (FHA) protein
MGMKNVDLRHVDSGKNTETRSTRAARAPPDIMLDCGRVNALRLRFPDHEPADLVLEPGVHPVGRRPDGRPGPIARNEAAVQLCVDRRGTWLQVREGARGVHVNGRPVRRMALLRAGDVVFVDGFELLLVADAPAALPSEVEPANEADARTVLRSVGGLNHGRCFALDAPRVIGRARECDVRIDGPAIAERHALLEPQSSGVALHDLGSPDGSLVNGHAVRHAWLRPGDQLVVGAHRFVVESPSPDTPRPRAEPAATGRDEDTAVSGSTPRGGTLRRMPWLLLAALLLSAALSLLLLYGAR